MPVRTINHGPTVSMYYKDPDGNQVELQVDAFDKAGAASYFDTEPFHKNPIGVLFDADKMVADYEAGVPEADLLRRPERDDAHALLRPGLELDGGAYRAARDRRAVRGAAPVACTRRRTRPPNISRSIPRARCRRC